MPTFVIGPALASGKLVAIFRDKRKVSSARMSAYYPRAKHRLPKVRAFVDYLVGTFQNKEWSGSAIRMERECLSSKRVLRRQQCLSPLAGSIPITAASRPPCTSCRPVPRWICS